METSPTRIEALLRHEGYVRALARRLVFDEDLARDVVQETWLAALRNAPRDEAAPRAWLGRLVRSFAFKAFRARGRRDQRERDSLPRELPTDPADLLEREDARRGLIEAVAALDEPWRSTLILRFFDEIEPAEIARRTGVPAKTVYTRIERGLELLRARLERKHGGRAWALALVHKLHLGPSSHGALAAAAAKVALQGAFVMGIVQKTLLAGAAIVAIAASLLYWNHARSVETPEAGVALAAKSSPVAAIEGEPSAPDATASRAPAELVPASPTAAPSPPANAARSGSLLLHLVWTDDRSAAAGIEVKAYPSSAEDYYQDALLLRTGADGSALADPILAGRVALYTDRGSSETTQIEAGARTELTLEIPPGFDLTGHVRDAAGRPVAGADVYVYGCIGSSYEGAVVARTGEDGAYFARSIDSNGLSFVSARAPGRAPTKQRLVVSVARAKVELDLAFEDAGGSLSGRVLSPDGEPCPGAAVVVGETGSSEFMRLADGSEGRSPAAQRAFTDEQGRFAFEGVAAGAQEIQARAKGFAPWKGRARVATGGATTLDVTLEAGASLEGTVRDEHGAPVAGAHVTTGGRYGFSSSFRKTDAGGRFAFAVVPIGEFEIDVEAEDQGTAKATLFGASGEKVTWDAVLHRGLVLAGRVVAPGREIAGWWFNVSAYGAEQPFLQTARSDAEGRFEVPGCPDLPLRIEAHAPDGGRWANAILEDVRATAGEVVIRPDPLLEPSVHLRGRVLGPDGAPAGGAQIIPGRRGFNTAPIEKTALDTGAFDLGPYPPGTWTVLVKTLGFADLRVEDHEVAPGETWELGDLVLQRGGQIVAKLHAGAGLEPAKASLMLTAADGRRDWMFVTGNEARSSTIAPGSYRLAVSGEGIALAAQAVQVRAGEETSVEVPLHAGVPVVVRIAGADARPLGEVSSLKIDGEHGPLASIDVFEGSGTLRWSGRLMPGAYHCSAKLEDGRAGSLELVVGTEPVERTLTVQ